MSLVKLRKEWQAQMHLRAIFNTRWIMFICIFSDVRFVFYHNSKLYQSLESTPVHSCQKLTTLPPVTLVKVAWKLLLYSLPLYLFLRTSIERFGKQLHYGAFATFTASTVSWTEQMCPTPRWVWGAAAQLSLRSVSHLWTSMLRSDIGEVFHWCKMGLYGSHPSVFPI